MNPWVYIEFWMVEAHRSSDGHRWTCDNVEDMPFVSLETAQANANRWMEEFPGTIYKPVKYLRCEEKEKVN